MSAEYQKKRLPVGVDNFEKIRSLNRYYVDKTGLIKELLTNMNEVTLFTRPRRFGKSLNMSMLQSFLEVGTDPALFDGLTISKEKELCAEHMGKYPVISISLKSMDGDNFEEAYAMYDTIINAEAVRHMYLMDSPKISSYEKKQFELLLNGECPKDKLRNSLWLMSSLLCKHYGQKTVILIDEYDVPLAKAYEFGYYDKMVGLIRGLFERTLKSNDNLLFSVLTGCMRVAKESIFTGLNNLEVLSITNKRYDEYFGFTEDEVQKMLSYYELEDCYQDIKTWYDGYLFGNESVYCPWSVINYLTNRFEDPEIKPKNYWANSSSNDIIRKLLNQATPTMREEIEKLIEGKTLTKKIYPEMTYAEINQSVEHIWSVMFNTGYLTSVQCVDSVSSRFIEFRIPNEEVRTIFEEQIIDWFNDRIRMDVKRYTEFNQAFFDADVPKINDMLNGYLSETISIRDAIAREGKKENFYHGFLLGILNFCGEWIIQSNHEAGNGYSDILIRYIGKPVGFEIEMKYGQSENLDTDCREALEQIEKQHYTDELKKFGCKHIYCYGIACYKKTCKVALIIETVAEETDGSIHAEP